MEEEAVDLKMNSTLFMPEQSISGGGVEGERRDVLRQGRAGILEWQTTWKNVFSGGEGRGNKLFL